MHCCAQQLCCANSQHQLGKCPEYRLKLDCECKTKLMARLSVQTLSFWFAWAGCWEQTFPGYHLTAITVVTRLSNKLNSLLAFSRSNYSLTTSGQSLASSYTLKPIRFIPGFTKVLFGLKRFISKVGRRWICNQSFGTGHFLSSFFRVNAGFLLIKTQPFRWFGVACLSVIKNPLTKLTSNWLLIAS